MTKVRYTSVVMGGCSGAFVVQYLRGRDVVGPLDSGFLRNLSKVLLLLCMLSKDLCKILNGPEWRACARCYHKAGGSRHDCTIRIDYS